ncbi:MAG TPA: type 4a pilus biogenesis protein PilO [Verrucomicrobiae bacterium]|nr:type 4a pilus biogenesis protein PilO [Verrucomicrobiae bacterium]
MKKFFAQLRPVERRLAVGVVVILILALNWWYIWPHFSDWGNLRRQMDDAQQKLALYQKTIGDTAKYEALVKGFENQGEFVPVSDQAINFLRTVQSQASSCGVGINRMGNPITHTNEFFVEQTQNIDVTGNDRQLVDFLYKLGSSASMIRVLDLELQPDSTRMRLNANVQLVASYQKNPTAPAAAPPKHKSTVATTPTPQALAALKNGTQPQRIPQPKLP